ncbi:MAG: protein kinase [Planctomycetota bacterium]|nr:protein kinase [Planctomycetota bacterium]
MTQPPQKIETQFVYLDPFLLDRARLDLGLSRKNLSGHRDLRLSVNTLLEAFNGAGLQPGTAKRIADFFECEVVDLLAPWDPRYVRPPEPPGPWSGAPEWEATGYLDQGRLAPNGLYYIVCRMQHRHTAAKQGRGKFYHLSWLPPAKREAMRHQLSRHADVCARVGVRPQIAANLTSTPVANDEGWWVIDDWVSERTLADHLRAAPWPREQLPQLLFQIALGLDALHATGIVFRELAPSRVLISANGGRVVLTDFELAKLLDGSPSVSGEWPEDPFRAPEVDGGMTTERADLYSLALVAAAAIAGPTFESGRVVELLGDAGMPKRLHRLAVDCSEPVPDRRPPDLSALLKELARWAERKSNGTASPL